MNMSDPERNFVSYLNAKMIYMLDIDYVFDNRQSIIGKLEALPRLSNGFMIDLASAVKLYKSVITEKELSKVNKKVKSNINKIYKEDLMNYSLFG